MDGASKAVISRVRGIANLTIAANYRYTLGCACAKESYCQDGSVIRPRSIYSFLFFGLSLSISTLISLSISINELILPSNE
jgi:hypothetical protein